MEDVNYCERPPVVYAPRLGVVYTHAWLQQHADEVARMQVDDVAEKLMPPGVRSLRNMLHATAVEVLLYLTPVHCHDMLSSLVEAMNAQFSRFMLRHPDFQVTSLSAAVHCGMHEQLDMSCACKLYIAGYSTLQMLVG